MNSINIYKVIVLASVVLFIGIVLYFLFPFNFGDHSSEGSSLQLVLILFRHGYRGPDKSFRTDPYFSKKYWPDGYGQLVLRGKEEMFNLGTFYREYYKGFIREYSADEVRVNSSGYDRCLMSASSLLAGWFPPEEDQIWTEELLWQPIPIHSKPATQDYVIAHGAPCAWYKEELQRCEKEIIANETDEDKWFWSYVSKHMGEPIHSYETLAHYFLTLQIEEGLGYELPSWTKEVFPKKMRAKAAMMMHLIMWTKDMLKVFSGPLVKEMFDQLKAKVDGVNEEKKLFLYSGHDLSIYSILNSLGFEVDEFIVNKFGTSIIFELHKSFDNYFVKLYFVNSTSPVLPHELHIPECPHPCSLEKLFDITEYIRTYDREEDCKLK